MARGVVGYIAQKTVALVKHQEHENVPLTEKSRAQLMGHAVMIHAFMNLNNARFKNVSLARIFRIIAITNPTLNAKMSPLPMVK